MKRSEPGAITVIELWKRCLHEGRIIDVDGLGRFTPHPDGYRFVADTQPKVFIAYVEEDLAAAQKLYTTFTQLGFNAWLDREKLLPGQNWPRSIERAIGVSDFFIPCFSARSGIKRGTFHSELRYALDCASRIPLDEIYIIPVRLEDCDVPKRIAREFQYVDLFPAWEKGVRQIVRSMQRQTRQRNKERLAS